MIPQDLKFTKTHEWARIEDKDIVAVGITEYAVGQLGDVVFVELPPAGQKVTAETPFGVIESVKAAVELFSPVSGEVLEANNDITENFDLLSEDPYEKGWMIKIKVADVKELDGLMSPADYEASVQKH